ncbi:hypothetical protein A3H10_02100 [Candidatus Uhrbacteria bacterium RIFCSPLOWO2_12_FULL_46_10]|uniref:Four helix bundle protein n=1 Tax=Candidatus Uhrbacteria bacterium RIFCSPLOWO2_01_FULL_47_25 TaxID=1802402 RepID=A0A1F7UXJ3_9BACT|nr:MAG: hypothetical protein A2752_04255 [Candidatus Uhrbacteria bacterium RIFCSPHIGHO2_01_FULL_46_23]OGL70308.1 MAG: hypothetical protein A3D60_01770 [Candidatus Uhrbacteria bacterium RIFCSPHIGHO2_02_FULL_47_29]OGL75094.1 MAG: hypothetical protein A3E96_01800 [Candidatus Uhrbacteria bacterium RIFCSPHIGHO2_12_FULL_46_13]OGL82995.1 MAG: hypothetical protein A2936_03515 [Candidatus Uhrbacteria bacterium RIFCSPLOWO2_01_FULL_47_25]OGL84441.1 MAG: hypothetical protein A3I37_03505 [Candidatus Uhrbact
MKSEIKSFRDLIVWQKSSNLATLIYGITNDFPKSEMYGLTSQMRRAVVSVSSNIAEGFKRNSRKEKVQFYTMAYGSLSELESQIDISKNLHYLLESQYQTIIEAINEASRLLDGIIRATNRTHNDRFFSPAISVLLAVAISVFYIQYSIFPTAPAGAVSSVRLFFIPENSEVVAGDIIKSDIWVDTQGNTINAVDISVSYDSMVELLSAEKNDSILNLWVEEPSFSDTTRRAKFTGGRTGGFEGRGIIGQLYWRNENAGGKATLGFDESSVVLLNDGLGTPAELERRQSDYNILAKGEGLLNLSSASHPDENKWYNQPFVRLSWPTIEGAIYSYLVTRDPAQLPDDTLDEPVGNIKLSDLTDGVYYFKLKQKKLGEEGWSSVVSRQIKIDKTPPEFIEAKISRDSELVQNKYFASFAANDKASIARYEIIEGDSAPEPILQPPFILKNQDRSVAVTIRAIDAAGNYKDIIIPALTWWQRPSIILYVKIGLIVGLALIAAVIIIVIIRRKKSI